jgi:hypothetical protein
MNMRITIVLVKLVFSLCRRLQNGTKSSKYVLCKIKEISSGTFEMLKSVYGKECLSRTSVFEWHKRFKKWQESLQDEW